MTRCKEFSIVQHARTASSFVVLSFVLLSLQSGFSQTSSSGNSYLLRERAMHAGEQLREYHRLIAQKGMKNKPLPEISQAPAEARISISKTMQTSSTIFFYDNIEGGAN